MQDSGNPRDLARSKGWLSYTPPEFQQSVLTACIIREYAAGQSIYRQNDPAGGLYCMIKGSVAVSMTYGEAGPIMLHVAQPASWFGEAAVITGLPRRIGLDAKRATKMLYLPLPSIHKIVADNPANWQFFALLAVINVELALAGGADLLIRDHAKRFVAVLLRVGNCRLASPAGGQPVTIEASQENLAEMANLSRNAAAAILRKLETERLVKRSYGHLQLLEPAKLRALLSEK
jgi:CRP/FNR family transcriptional regulator, cyclic AMP receptor protein